MVVRNGNVEKLQLKRIISTNHKCYDAKSTKTKFEKTKNKCPSAKAVQLYKKSLLLRKAEWPRKHGVIRKVVYRQDDSKSDSLKRSAPSNKNIQAAKKPKQC